MSGVTAQALCLYARGNHYHAHMCTLLIKERTPSESGSRILYVHLHATLPHFSFVAAWLLPRLRFSLVSSDHQHEYSSYKTDRSLCTLSVWYSLGQVYIVRVFSCTVLRRTNCELILHRVPEHVTFKHNTSKEN